MTMLKIFLFLGLFLIPSLAFAHPGRTDSSGCHTCRTNCASWGLSQGEYHCHQSKGTPQPLAPVTSTRNEAGVGITVPAPEYAVPKTTTQAPQPKPKAQIQVQAKTPTNILPAGTTSNQISASTVNATSSIETKSLEAEKPTPLPIPEVKRGWFSRLFSSLFR